MSKVFKGYAILLTLAVAVPGTLNAQSENGFVLENVKPNFYITTPQSGQQTAVGQDRSTGQVVKTTARASAPTQPVYNTYTSQSNAQPAQQAQAGYTVTTPQQASYAQAYYASQQASGNYAAYTSNNASSRRGVVSTSAAAPQAVQQTSYPSYVAHSREERKGFLSRLIHKNERPQAKPAIQQVSNNYKPSSLSGTVQSGTASWYGSDFHGGKTANGERYNMESMTAAHKTLPFGTMVRVRNERNGQECVVRINNRGPFIRGRILDVSKAAARQLGMVSSGVAKITMQVVGKS